MLQLSDLVQSVVDAGVSRGVLHLGKLRPQSSNERIGRYSFIGEDRRGGVWLGMHFRLWRTYGMTPLWLVLHNTEFGRAAVLQKPIDLWAAKHGVFTARDEKGDLDQRRMGVWGHLPECDRDESLTTFFQFYRKIVLLLQLSVSPVSCVL